MHNLNLTAKELHEQEEQHLLQQAHNVRQEGKEGTW